MGNCQDQFQNVHAMDQQFDTQEKQDVSAMSVINRTHMKVHPQNIEDIKIGAIRSEFINTEIDNERLHDTRALNAENALRIKEIKPPQYVMQQSARVEELDYDFYHQLALPEYSYRDLPEAQRRDFENLQINENQDRYGVKYIGEWKNREIHGNGVLTSNTKKYIGQFKNGLKHFHGRQIQKNQVYEGQFVDGRRKGEGIRYLSDRTETGTFDENLVQGKIQYKNGSIFTGTLHNSLFHGPTCSYTDSKTGTRYNGEFTYGKMTGNGHIFYPNGRQYEGQFLEGMKHGHGRFSWNDHTTYRGGYRYDQKHGRGQLTMDGKTYDGNFVNGMLDGEVTIIQGRSKTQKLYKYGKEIDEDQASIDENGLPEHWN